jgi:hypothetical protein
MAWEPRVARAAALDRIDHLYHMQRDFKAMMREACPLRLVAQERLVATEVDILEATIRLQALAELSRQGRI